MTKPSIQKYGKASGPLLSIRQDFFTRNDEHLAEQKQLSEVYTAQEPRSLCKCCNHPIDGTNFRKKGIGYVLCPNCTHLNGVHEDSPEFCAAVYTDDAGAQYATHYQAADKAAFQTRVDTIYSPKAVFLLESLAQGGHDLASLKFADFGAGSGFFVSALMGQGVDHVSGFEVSQTQVEYAKEMNPNSDMTQHALEETSALVGSIDADVVSVIGVLEHLQHPREFLRAVVKNSRISNLFLSVPLFSPCVFFEMVFPEIMQRQLTAGHTHLYTEASLDWTRDEFGFEKAAEWWFGTDMVDLFRMVQVTMRKSSDLLGMTERWAEIFGPAIDAMQLEMDKQHLSSEVHQLWRIRR